MYLCIYVFQVTMNDKTYIGEKFHGLLGFIIRLNKVKNMFLVLLHVHFYQA